MCAYQERLNEFEVIVNRLQDMEVTDARSLAEDH